MVHEFKIVTTLVIASEEEGAEDIVKNNLSYKATYRLSDITCVEQAFNHNGNIRIHHCIITHDQKGDILIKGSYNKIKELIFNNVRQVGYATNK